MNGTRSKILAFVRDCGYSPSVRSIATVVGVSPSTVQHHLDALERDGVIERRGPERRIMVKS